MIINSTGGKRSSANGAYELEGILGENVVKGDTVYAVEKTIWSSDVTKLTVPTNFTASLSDTRFSPTDGTHVAVLSGGNIYRYVITGSTVTAKSTVGSGFYAFTFSPDGKYLAGCASASPYLRVYRINADYTLTALGSIPYPSYTSQVLQYTPDGRYLIYGSATPAVYSVVGESYASFGNLSAPGGAPTAMRFSPDGQLLLIGTSSAPYLVCYINNGDGTFTKSTDPIPYTIPAAVYAIEFTPDGRYCIIGLAGGTSVVILVVDGTVLTSTNQIGVTGVSGVVNDLAVTPDGETLFIGANSTPFLYAYRFADGKTGERLSMPTVGYTVYGLAVNVLNDTLVATQTGQSGGYSFPVWKTNNVNGRYLYKSNNVHNPAQSSMFGIASQPGVAGDTIKFMSLLRPVGWQPPTG